MINQAQKNQIKALLRDERWPSLVVFIDTKVKQWQKESFNCETAYQELKAIHKRDGKVDGIDELLKELDQI